MAEAIVDLSITDDHEELARQQARLAAEAIAFFDAHALDGQEPTTFNDSSTFAGVFYLLDVAARRAHERRGIRPGVMRMVNDFGILVISQAGGNTFQVAPKGVMMDSRAQPVMISKNSLCSRIWIDGRRLGSHSLAM